MNTPINMEKYFTLLEPDPNPDRTPISGRTKELTTPEGLTIIIAEDF